MIALFSGKIFLLLNIHHSTTQFSQISKRHNTRKGMGGSSEKKQTRFRSFEIFLHLFGPLSNKRYYWWPKKYLRPNASINDQRTNVEWKMGAIFTEGNVLRNLSAPHSI
jgi:hypothetical protein